jgi:hypothetical protein
MVVTQLPRTAAGCFGLDGGWVRRAQAFMQFGLRSSSVCAPFWLRGGVNTANPGAVQTISVRRWTEADIADPGPLGVHGTEYLLTYTRAMIP